MKYYTAKEACFTFPHLMPDNVELLRRHIKVGKFPPHDAMVKRGNGTFQAWSEHTILNWQTMVKNG